MSHNKSSKSAADESALDDGAKTRASHNLLKSLLSSVASAFSAVKSILRRFSAMRSERIEGEVLARGPNVFAGYLNLPEKTKEAFSLLAGGAGEGSGVRRGSDVAGDRAHPHPSPLPKGEREVGERWFRTGDLGWIDRAGFLHLTGRVSTMIVTEGGKHVQPDAVEEVYQAHPAIREIGILQKKDPPQLVAVVVPAQRQRAEVRDQRSEVSGQRSDAKRRSRAGGDPVAPTELDSRPPTRGNDTNSLDETIRRALDEQGRRLRPYERVSEFVITSEALPKTQLGKIQHHLLEEVYERAKSGRAGKEKTGPMPEAEMSGEDQELLRDAAAQAVWQWLAQRFPKARLTPDSHLRMDLEVDSMEWLNLTMEIGERIGVELDEQAIARIETVRDLLQEVSTASIGAGGGKEGPDLETALREPEKFLDDDQRKWLKPLNRTQRILARAMFAVNRALMRVLFRVKAAGLEHLPADQQCVIAPNHVSYLDSLVIAAALDNARLARMCWAGWTGAAFRGPLMRSIARLARIVPVDPDRAALTSLAVAAAVLKGGRGDNLVWFPEGARSPDGTLQPLRPGLGILLEHQPSLVVPAHIAGAHEALPPGRFLPRLHLMWGAGAGAGIRITFGEAVKSETLKREGKGDQPGERITQGLEKRLRRLARLK